MKNKNKRILWTAVAVCLLIAIVTVVVIIMMQRGKTEELDKSGDGATQVSVTPIPGQNENNDPDGTPVATPEAAPTSKPTEVPVATPEATPTEVPVATPEATPTPVPTEVPEATPTPVPTEVPEVTPTPELIADKYLEFNGDPYGWCFKRNTTNEQPGDYGWGTKLKFTSLNTYYVDKSATAEDKVIYLTFDCGYENGYTGIILDVLKENNIKAIFFLTKEFIETQPELAKRMKEEGHFTGNHTTTHPNLAKLSPESVMAEITECEEYFKEVTGYDMDKYCRPPEGSISSRVLNILNDMGYKTILWSIAYLDYDVKNQPGEAFVIEHFTKNHHNGAIPLIHTISQSNTEALPEVIQLLKDAGYRFGTVDELK